MKKIVVALVVLSMFGINFSKPINATPLLIDVDENKDVIISKEDWQVSDSRAKLIFDYVNTSESNTRSTINPNLINGISNDFGELGYTWHEDFNELFRFALVFNKDNLEIVYQNEDTLTVVLSNNDDGSNMLLEYRKLEDEYLLMINDAQYLIIQENFNYYIYSPDGNAVPLTVSYITFGEEVYSRENNNEMLGKDPKTTRGSWGQEYGPFQKTSHDWVQVVDIISVAGQIIEIVHPVLGRITTVAADSVSIGMSYVKVYYIKYWQSYMSDCPTYVKERSRYYEDSGYSNYVAQYTSYFHSVRPDYAGGACLNY